MVGKPSHWLRGRTLVAAAAIASAALVGLSGIQAEAADAPTFEMATNFSYCQTHPNRRVARLKPDRDGWWTRNYVPDDPMSGDVYAEYIGKFDGVEHFAAPAYEEYFEKCGDHYDAVSGLKVIDGKTYLFCPNAEWAQSIKTLPGWKLVGWYWTDDAAHPFADSDGYSSDAAPADATWYYFDTSEPGTPQEGAALTGWQYLQNASTAQDPKPEGWYLFASNGQMKRGWQNVGDWYYLDECGVMATGWQDIDGSRYYLGTSGRMRTGWIELDGTWYYLDSSGAAATGWKNVGGTWYWFDDTGAMATGWQQVGGTWYLFGNSGAMRTGWQHIGGTWYWLDGSGAMATGWRNVDGTWYWFKDSGAMVTDWKQIGGTWYYFSGSGAMQSGWLNLGGAWYYLSDGAKLTGWQNIGGTWYWFNGSGVMGTGWQQIGGTWYWLGGSGAMATGWQSIGGAWYYFYGSGAMATGWQVIGSTWYYFYDSGAMASNTWIGSSYVGSDGAWVQGYGQSSSGGSSSGSDSWDGQTVYVSPNGKYYHSSRSCSAFNRASRVDAISISQVGKRTRCPKCF